MKPTDRNCPSASSAHDVALWMDRKIRVTRPRDATISTVLEPAQKQTTPPVGGVIYSTPGSERFQTCAKSALGEQTEIICCELGRGIAVINLIRALAAEAGEARADCCPPPPKAERGANTPYSQQMGPLEAPMPRSPYL